MCTWSADSTLAQPPDIMASHEFMDPSPWSAALQLNSLVERESLTPDCSWQVGGMFSSLLSAHPHQWLALPLQPSLPVPSHLAPLFAMPSGPVDM